MSGNRLISVLAVPLVGGTYSGFTPTVLTTDGKIFLQSSASAITIDMPIRPYKCRLYLNMDIGKTEDNQYLSYDNGIEYDTSSCECTFILPVAQAKTLNTFLREYRTESYTLSMVGIVKSGFYPFLPHRGNAGPFRVSCEVLKQRGMITEPFRYFGVDLRFTNVGSWPTFTLPTETWEGDWSIAGVSNLRFPDELTDVQDEFSRFVAYDEKTFPYYDTHGTENDAGNAGVALKLNTSKAAALFNRLSGTIRAETFTVSSQEWQYPFGENYGDNATFSVMLTKNEIFCTHDEYDVWSTDLSLHRKT